MATARLWLFTASGLCLGAIEKGGIVKNQTKTKMDWYTWNLVQLFAISTMFMALAAGNVTQLNLYSSILVIFITLAIIDLFWNFNLFGYVSSILIVAFYDLLWGISLKVGLNIYSIFLNVAIGIILAILLWVAYDSLQPIKGVWNRKIIPKRISIAGMPFLYLIGTGLMAYVFLVILSFGFSVLNFAIALFAIGYFTYYTLDTWIEAKKYTKKEKGGVNGKPKPKPE